MTESLKITRYTASDGVDVELSPEIVSRYIITGGVDVPEKEIYSFIAKCQARGLNPLAGDAYMIIYGDKANVIVSKDFFMRTATQQKTFDGLKAGVIVVKKSTGELIYREGALVGVTTETLVGGWAEVYDKGRSIPSRAEVSLSEYDQKKSLWKTKPATMIRKVALVQALREAYPVAYGGLYDASEMPAVSPVSASQPDDTPEVIDEPAVVDEAHETPGDDVQSAKRKLYEAMQLFAAAYGMDYAAVQAEVEKRAGMPLSELQPLQMLGYASSYAAQAQMAKRAESHLSGGGES